MCFCDGSEKLNLLSAVLVMEERLRLNLFFQLSCIFCILLSTVCFCDGREKLKFVVSCVSMMEERSLICCQLCFCDGREKLNLLSAVFLWWNKKA